MINPHVSVVIPMYNRAKTIGETIQSVLAQTYPHFEIVIVDDGSTDESVDIVHRYMQKENRIRLVRQENQGLGRVANRCIDEAHGTYIARLDADDLCMPNRLERQVEYLDAHPHTGLVGSMYRTFGEGVEPQICQLPQKHEDIKAALLFRSSVLHSSVMFRACLVKEYSHDNRLKNPEPIRYPEVVYGEDYGFWIRFALKHPVENIPDVLIAYRLWPEQTTLTHVKEKFQTLIVNQQSVFLHELKIKPNEEEFSIHRHLAFDQIPADVTFLRTAADWLLRLRDANMQLHLFDENALAHVLTGRYIALIRKAAEIHSQEACDLHQCLIKMPFYKYVEIPLPKPVFANTHS